MAQDDFRGANKCGVRHQPTTKQISTQLFRIDAEGINNLLHA